jgi:inositol transport system substrate-binding protein
MKTTLTMAGLALLMSGAATAETIGVSIVNFDDRFQTVLRTGMTEYAATLDGVDLQIEDAQNDMGQQLDQINNFIAAGVDAIIVTAGVSMDDVVVVDATQDALAAMQADELDVTVFQNGAAQGRGAVDTALALARGEEVESRVYIPF